MTTRAERVAEEAAEAIREINHLTISYRLVASDYVPSDLYRIVGAIDRLIARLPQACQQLAGIIGAHDDAGRLRAAEGNEPAALAVAAIGGLQDAGALLGAVRRHVADAQQALAWLYVDEGAGE